MTEMAFSPTDCRRACALLVHAAGADSAGMAAIWEETTTDDQCADLLAAVVAVVLELVPGFRTKQGMAALREFAATFAESETAADGC